MLFDLTLVAKKLTVDILRIKPGEEVVITYDTESHEEVALAVAGSVHLIGGKPMLIKISAPSGVGKAADPEVPLRSLSAALKECDVWIEFNEKWLLYSTAYEEAVKNESLRYICLVGMDPDMMKRTLNIDIKRLQMFMEEFTGRIKRSKNVRIRSKAGTDICFENSPARPVICDSGKADKPGIYMLPGQISWTPIIESINGTIVFDGSVVPPLGLLRSPIVLKVENGMIKDISGGNQADVFRAWLGSFNHPAMFRLAHISPGFNPGAKLTGNVLEDERIWGCTEWGIGYIGEDMIPDLMDIDQAPSHCDGVCLNSSIVVDGVELTHEGKIVDEELIKLSPVD